jgi:hypothetical protein
VEYAVPNAQRKIFLRSDSRKGGLSRLCVDKSRIAPRALGTGFAISTIFAIFAIWFLDGISGS